VISQQQAHPSLVSEEQFVAVRTIHTAPTRADGTRHDYALAEQISCGICGRLMDGHCVNRRPGYDADTDTTTPDRDRR
jgi:hypothetical protein